MWRMCSWSSSPPSPANAEHTLERALQASALVAVGITAKELRMVAIYVIALVISVSIHEFAHAFSADKLGDPTPRQEDRLTLNPVSHADPIGTLLLPIFAGLSHLPLLGWGRPVPTNPRYYTRKISMRAGLALVAFAGPLSNVIQAILTMALWLGLAAVGLVGTSVFAPTDGISEFLTIFLVLNVVLALFNLLPFHPLDGGKVLAWLLPPKYEYIDDFLMRHGGWIILGLVFLPGMLGLPDVLSIILTPVITGTLKLMVTLLGLLG